MDETSQGMSDLNGDGDALDCVLHTLDWRTGASRNLMLDAHNGIASLDGDLAAFWVSESAQGGTDLHGDGDASDTVIHILDTATGVTRNMGLAMPDLFPSGVVVEAPAQVQDGRVAFFAGEADQGADLNGDGDREDYVLHLYSSATEATRNTGQSQVAPSSLDQPWVFQPAGELLALEVSESTRGAADLNGDGDASDQVLHVYDLTQERVVHAGRGMSS